ncbi:Disks Large-Associated Protein 2 [Manis pentadactyla]|nr:Disks Large-Associated Protein 2 [Manis pentadactyla]
MTGYWQIGYMDKWPTEMLRLFVLGHNLRRTLYASCDFLDSVNSLNLYFRIHETEMCYREDKASTLLSSISAHFGLWSTRILQSAFSIQDVDPSPRAPIWSVGSEGHVHRQQAHC